MEDEAILNRIDELFNYIQQVEGNYQFHLNWIIAILAFVVAAAGTSLYVLAKYWFNTTAQKEIKDAEKRIKNELQSSMEKEIHSYYQTYTMSITAGSMIEIPYEQISKEVHPSVFVRTHDPEGKCRIDVLEEKHMIRIENVNWKYDDVKVEDLPIDLLVMKAKLKI